MDEKATTANEGTVFDAFRSDRLVINVGGFRHLTSLTTLKNIPDTRLSWIAENHPACADYDPVLGEYFFDRHPLVFSEVLNYYRTGKLHCPADMCYNLFAEELSFWGVRDREMEPCCWVLYKQHMNVEKTLKSFHLESVRKKSKGSTVYKQRENSKGLLDESENAGENLRQKWQKFRPKVWKFLDDPRSSIAARVLVAISSLFIVVSVTHFCLLTMEPIRTDKTATKTLEILYVITSVWFTAELALRLVFCPGIKAFIKNPLNWIDAFALLPFYLHLKYDAPFLSWLVVIRTLRIFKLLSYSFTFKVLLHTIAASKHELFLVGVSLFVPIILFSSMIYVAERDDNKEMFPSVPESFWWAIVTVTTLGYGDVVPVTRLGKLIGAMCAICGIIIVALPVSVIGSNFSYFYRQARMRVQRPHTSRRMPALSHIPTNLATKTRTRRAPRRSPAGHHVGGRFKASRLVRNPAVNSRRRRKQPVAQPTSKEFEMSQLLPTEFLS